MVIDEAIELYMADKSRRLRGNTLEGYASAIRRHILPAWSGAGLEEVTHDGLQAWVDSIPTYGAAHKAFKTFRQVYRWSLRKLQLRIWDVTQGIELPGVPVTRRETLSAAEEREMLRGIRGEEWEAAVLLGASLGLRRCEAVGVDWSDVDWRGGWVHIQRGAHWVGGEAVEYGTKTRLSDRWLKLPRFALERLRRIRGSRRSGRVCSLPPHRAAAAYRSHCRRYGLPWVPMTNLRHTYATLAIGAGAAIEDVSVALGHSTVDMVTNHYLETTRAVARRPAEAYERVMAA